MAAQGRRRSRGRGQRALSHHRRRYNSRLHRVDTWREGSVPHAPRAIGRREVLEAVGLCEVRDAGGNVDEAEQRPRRPRPPSRSPSQRRRQWPALRYAERRLAPWAGTVQARCLPPRRPPPSSAASSLRWSGCTHPCRERLVCALGQLVPGRGSRRMCGARSGRSASRCRRSNPGARGKARRPPARRMAAAAHAR